jgi:2'-5' RNA ligase
VDETDHDPRIYLACPVTPSPAISEVQRALVGVFPDVIPHRDDQLHVTVGHVGKASELRGEIETIASLALDPVAFGSCFRSLVDQLGGCAVPADEVKVTGLELFGHAGLQLVATLEHTDHLERGRACVERTVVAMLQGLGILDPEPVLRRARSLAVLSAERFRPHVTLAEWKDHEERADVRPKLASVPVPHELRVRLGVARVEALR